jgi:hypothetical protein
MARNLSEAEILTRLLAFNKIRVEERSSGKYVWFVQRIKPRQRFMM